MIIFSFSQEGWKRAGWHCDVRHAFFPLWNMILTFCSSFFSYLFGGFFCVMICYLLIGKKMCHIRMSLSLFTQTWITILMHFWLELLSCFSNIPPVVHSVLFHFVSIHFSLSFFDIAKKKMEFFQKKLNILHWWHILSLMTENLVSIRT